MAIESSFLRGYGFVGSALTRRKVESPGRRCPQAPQPRRRHADLSSAAGHDQRGRFSPALSERDQEPGGIPSRTVVTLRGLFQHYWVLAKFLLTLGAAMLLLLHTGSLLPALSVAA